MKQLLSLAVIASALASPVLLSGCNTFRGVGQDVKSAGNAIERAADKKNTSNSQPPAPEN